MFTVFYLFKIRKEKEKTVQEVQIEIVDKMYTSIYIMILASLWKAKMKGAYIDGINISL